MKLIAFNYSHCNFVRSGSPMSCPVSTYPSISPASLYNYGCKYTCLVRNNLFMFCRLWRAQRCDANRRWPNCRNERVSLDGSAQLLQSILLRRNADQRSLRADRRSLCQGVSEINKFHARLPAKCEIASLFSLI